MDIPNAALAVQIRIELLERPAHHDQPFCTDEMAILALGDSLAGPTALSTPIRVEVL